MKTMFCSRGIKIHATKTLGISLSINWKDWIKQCVKIIEILYTINIYRYQINKAQTLWYWSLQKVLWEMLLWITINSNRINWHVTSTVISHHALIVPSNVCLFHVTGTNPTSYWSTNWVPELDTWYSVENHCFKALIGIPTLRTTSRKGLIWVKGCSLSIIHEAKSWKLSKDPTLME